MVVCETVEAVVAAVAVQTAGVLVEVVAAAAFSEEATLVSPLILLPPSPMLLGCGVPLLLLVAALRWRWWWW